MSSRELPTFTGPNLTGEQQVSFLPDIERRDLRVARVSAVTPRYRRIVLTGDDLAAGFPFVRFACGDHVTVYFPAPGSDRVVAYRRTPDGGWEVDSTEGEPVRRDYTPRAWDPVARELTLDFVVHDHGVAGVWARDARPGDPVVVMGPRANWLLPENYPRYLAVGDETALPSISRLVEEAPAGAHVTAVVEVADAGEEQPLRPGDGVGLEVLRVHRDTAPVAAGHSGALETALRGVPLPDDTGELFVFAAGEAGAMRGVRRYLRGEVGLPRRQLSVDGYWKAGTADHDHHTGVDEEPDEHEG
ncbi:siderophore-interacting protein [Streptomyces lonarensis]|uniref:Siderophore-interacting protein n=1 Tax=Streptomyces lonarensis TaxID=700599 RepID=A0A7X6D2F6_9ACTN|nr:siderophore-interacting protein [Streptomyces lonarensis]NJQ06850.1 siderophore-interacting protein [Streptomyces lonarensis]